MKQHAFLQQPELPFVEVIGSLTSKFSELWISLPNSSFPSSRVYSDGEQRENGEKFERLMSDAAIGTESQSDAEARIRGLRNRIRGLVLETAEGEERDQMKGMLSAFSDAGDEFVRRAREFDRTLSLEGIFQALRNLWIINSMQEAFGVPVCVTPSALAYSLLYTYTDNFLDDVNVSPESKRGFNDIFGQRLEGYDVPQDSRRISKVSALVGLIESEYPRRLFPGVYASLLAIHRAQQMSLLQRQTTPSGCGRDILTISVEKGGTSVVADAYVTKGWLAPAETDFAFGYGVFLQFIDDLQDVTEDMKGASETLFTHARSTGTLDRTTNQLVHYLRQILFAGTPLKGPKAEALTDLIHRGSLGLILESVALNAQMFNRDYLKAVERYSPIRFETIRSLHSKRSSLQHRFNHQARNLDRLKSRAANRPSDGMKELRALARASKR